MKIAALDLGDRWVGVAISDALGITARPCETVEAAQLEAFLPKFIEEERIGTIVAGLPITLRGTISAQTQKIKDQVADLEKQFSSVKWVLWDERLTSKQAAKIKPAKTKEAKRASHSHAAAIILRNYLDRLHFEKSQECGPE